MEGFQDGADHLLGLRLFMGFAVRTRIVLLLVAILVLAPVLSFASPIMDAGRAHDAQVIMAMVDSGASSAQGDCNGCADVDGAKAAMGAHCTVICVPPAMLPAHVAVAEQIPQPHWTIAAAENGHGITTSIDPYPPDVLS